VGQQEWSVDLVWKFVVMHMTHGQLLDEWYCCNWLLWIRM